MTDKDKECRSQRDAFEKWARVHLAYLGGPFLRDCNDPEPDRDYQKWEVEDPWRAWQACAAHYQPLLETKDASIRDLEDGIAHNEELLEAKDAEIAELKAISDGAGWFLEYEQTKNAELKALLEQAREALQKCATSPWHDTAKIAQEALTAVERAQ